jgi:hypothetical protein
MYVKVKIAKRLYSEFKVIKGVRQGYALVSVLINVVPGNFNIKS